MIRERYLRDDIPCGSALCEICQYDQTPLVGPRLSSTPRQLPDILQGRPHYVMVDASVAFHQIDVWEHVEMKDVILLSSVLAQVKDKSLPVHDRLRALAANKDRSFYVFSNDFHATAFVERQKGESLEDYRHRLVHSSIHWYQQHQTVSIVLICNVEVDQKKAQSVGIDSVTLAEYADAMKHIVPELVDILADQAESQDAVEKESYADVCYFKLERVNVSTFTKRNYSLESRVGHCSKENYQSPCTTCLKDPFTRLSTDKTVQFKSSVA